MKYDFDTPINRRNSHCLKWDVGEKELPMWVADMDFETAPEVKAALLQRAEHGVFGYSVVPDGWNTAYVNWWKQRHHFEMEPEWLVFCTGVVPAISSIVRKLTTPGENVLIQTPVYNIFFNSIVNNGRRVLECPLSYDAGKYGIDFEALERNLQDPQTTLMIFCNPHNPVGKIWNRDTIAKIGRLCVKHHVTVISDEIHCDLTDPEREYVPFASASSECRECSIICMAPTKAFNLAGLQTAAVMIPNPVLRHKVWRGLNTDEVAEPNAFAVDAAIAAFTEGDTWLDELRAYLYENKQIASAYLREHLPQLLLVPSEATYLLWIDCTAVTDDAGKLVHFLREHTGLYLSEGSQYGSAGTGFLRMNIACPKTLLLDGLGRLKAGLETYKPDIPV